jgi:hypothetical protein
VVSRRRAPRWRVLRGCEFDGPLTAAEVRGEVELFAASASGEIFRWRARRESDWEPLGRIGSLVSLAAQSVEAGRKLVLFGFTTERMVFSKVWDGRGWDGPREEWTKLGLLDEIDRPSVPASPVATPRRPKRKSRT